MEKQSTKTESSPFRKHLVFLGACLFYGPLVWLLATEQWEIALCLFLVVIGNNLCMVFNKHNPFRLKITP